MRAGPPRPAGKHYFFLLPFLPFFLSFLFFLPFLAMSLTPFPVSVVNEMLTARQRIIDR